MSSFKVDTIEILFDHGGDKRFNKYGYINWLGLPVKVFTREHAFDFGLEGRIHRIKKANGSDWPNNWDWLQRTLCNDWVYYDYSGWYESTDLTGDHWWAVNGRTDLPTTVDDKALDRPYVQGTFNSFDYLITSINHILRERPEIYTRDGQLAEIGEQQRVWEFLEKVAQKNSSWLAKDAKNLHQIIEGNLPVLPPDTIKVDYQVIPVMIMDGCGYKCKFCDVRGNSVFNLRNEGNISEQLDALKRYLGNNLYNYNSVVLGQNNALAAGLELIEYAASEAYATLRCGESYHRGSNLFMFSTNKAFLEALDSTFDMLEQLPFEHVYINVGWEAVTAGNLRQLGKPQKSQQVFQGMTKAGKINRNYNKIHISGNFIIGNTLSGNQAISIASAIRSTEYGGTIYLSPLHGQNDREQTLRDLKVIREAELPAVQVWLYTMQRL